MGIEVNQLFEMLASDEDDIQQQGLAEAAKVKYLSIFILPAEGKNLWENCAKVLASKTDDELEPYFISLFTWFQDGNWPGFMIIFERFRNMPANLIFSAYMSTIHCAQDGRKNVDEVWLTWLSGLIRNKELLDLLPGKQQRLMKKYYRKWWEFQE